MEDIDVVVYAGQVNVQGYLNISQVIEQQKTPTAKKVFFIPITSGGDPNAGYRIARALGHYYEDVYVGIPSVCKSAGTLMCIGANELVVADRGELGPLDIQMSSKDEIMGMSSGLDIMQAITALQDTLNGAFKSYLYDLRFNGRLGTKVASDIASKMAIGLVAPIAQQIDPLKLGEHQRALTIAVAYGERLNAKFYNTSREQIERLLTSYPVHGFVIDRKEVAELFKRVRSPNEAERTVFNRILNILGTDYGFEIANTQPKCFLSNFNSLLPNIPSNADLEQNDVRDDQNPPKLDNSEAIGTNDPKKQRRPRSSNRAAGGKQ